MKHFVTFIILLFFITDVSAQNENDLNYKIDKIVDSYYQKGEFNGNILVAVDGKIILHKSYGFSNFEDSIPLDTNDIFYLASISKIFTSTAIMLLSEEKKLSVNHKIRKYLPELPEIYEPVQIKHLLSHTGGIPNDKNNIQATPGLKNTDILNYLKNQKNLNFKTGYIYEYGNFGFVLLAFIIEKTSGMSYKEFVEKKILIPSKMQNTIIRDTYFSYKDYKIVNSYIDNKKVNFTTYTYGGGGIYSTTSDILKFDQAFFSDEIVKKSTRNKILKQFVLENGATINYGLGWMITTDENDKTVGHLGGSSGFSTLYEHKINSGITLIMLTNIDEKSKLYALKNEIYKELEK